MRAPQCPKAPINSRPKQETCALERLERSIAEGDERKVGLTGRPGQVLPPPTKLRSFGLLTRACIGYGSDEPLII
jgi:hypothetical protein